MFKTVFEKHAPLKKKHLRPNHSKFVTKEVSKNAKIKIKKKVFERLNRRIEMQIQKTKYCSCIFIKKKPKRTTMKILT